MTFLFATALFVNALLLFLVQPMFAKLLLPPFGGSPAVWTTCMLFFQSALLAGYAYSHSVVKLRKPWQQVALHLVVITLPFLALPIAVSTSSSQTDDPIRSVLWLSVIAVGAPFFALSTGAPLLQRWFAASHQRAPVDPYFLYAASNVGSFASLLLYPTVVEPALALSTQTQAWSIGYSAAVLLTLTCAVVMWWRAPRAAATAAAQAPQSHDAVTWTRRGRWIALAFVPSSLMLAVTAYLSTDVAAVPLLWVLPLSLYLITFVITFSAYAARFLAIGRRFLPIVLLYLTWLLVSESLLPLAQMATMHLVAFFVLALLCHGALAEDRPAATHLTDFYLSVAVGGALGGVFNSLLAPLLFDSVLEYPLALACAVWLLTMHPATESRTRRAWWAKLAVVALLTLAALLWPGDGLPIMLLTSGLLLAAVVVCLSVSREPRRLGVCILLMLGLYVGIGGRGSRDVAYASRTFFGTYRVVSEPEPPSFTLFHGTTMHGRQLVSSTEPLTYFHRKSPIARILETRPAGAVRSVGVIGLGIGTLAAYAQPGEQWTFYEIDPEVERIARDARYFTHLQRCGPACTVVVGDARISLQQRPETFDVIVIDAFSSDAIPIHLLTREAVELYFSRLNPDGVLALHISNNHLKLRPVVAGIARDLDLVGRARFEPLSDLSKGYFASHWALLARSEAALGPLATDKSWDGLQPDGRRVWTDDFSNLWSVITWGQ